MKKISFTLIFVIGLLLSASTISFAAIPSDAQQFLRVEQVLKLIDEAKRAGLSATEIEQITITDGKVRLTVKEIAASTQAIARALIIEPNLLDSSVKLPFKEGEARLDYFLNAPKDVESQIKFYSAADVYSESFKTQKAMLDEELEKIENHQDWAIRVNQQ